MKKVCGTIYNISPQCHNFLLEYSKLLAEFSQDKNNENTIWTCKPVGQNRERGIFLIKDLGVLCYNSNAIVQRYIENPLLIDGYKFDLKLYVCIPPYLLTELSPS
jgi:tubulin polyglutamylase TTLL2